MTTAARRVIPSRLPGKESGGGRLQAFLGHFAETPPENRPPKGERRSRLGWCPAGASGAPLVELVGDLGQNRVARGNLKRTWGAPVAPGRRQAQIWRIWFSAGSGGLKTASWNRQDFTAGESGPGGGERGHGRYNHLPVRLDEGLPDWNGEGSASFSCVPENRRVC